MIRKLLLITALGSILVSCNMFSQKKGKPKDFVARVYDKYLTPNDLKGLIPVSSPQNDSLEIINAYIQNWIRQELILKHAEENLNDANKEFSKLIEQYRNSLIVYAYESEIVKQKLDTVIPISEIEKYYQNNQNEFHLRENIVQAKYVIIKKNKAASVKIKSLLMSNRDSDLEKLIVLCKENQAEYSIETNNWMSFSELEHKIPITIDNQNEFLRKNKFIEVNDSLSSYYLNIISFQSKESISPLSFEMSNIRTILLNKRKSEFLSQIEETLFRNATKNNDYEIRKK